MSNSGSENTSQLLRPKRPVRGALLAFLLLSLLFVVCTPLMPQEVITNRLVFLVLGLAFSAFLALVGVGLALSGTLVRSWAFPGGILVWALLLLIAWFGLRLANGLPLGVFLGVLYAVGVITGALLLLLVALAARGWIRFARRGS